MVEKKTKNKTDQAIDLVYAQVQKESGITPMDFFMVGISLTGLGLSMVNASWAPRSLQILTGAILTGLVAIVIISREFAITGLRLLAANKGIVLPSERMGKHKTVWQIVTVCFFLLLLSIKEFATAGFGHSGMWWSIAWNIGGGILIALALALTLYSGVGYLWKNRALISAS